MKPTECRSLITLPNLATIDIDVGLAACILSAELRGLCATERMTEDANPREIELSGETYIVAVDPLQAIESTSGCRRRTTP